MRNTNGVLCLITLREFKISKSSLEIVSSIPPVHGMFWMFLLRMLSHHFFDPFLPFSDSELQLCPGNVD
jgi:hypothetical protein